MKQLPFVLVLFAGACGTETIVHELDEKQANKILVLLSEQRGIAANKLRVDTGRKVYYDIAVPAKSKVDAMALLNDLEYPRRDIRDYTKVFEQQGLIPTAAQEKAKKLEALEGEIAKQLLVINDVLDAEVNITMPEDSALRTTDEAAAPTTASVTIRYMPRNGSKPVSEPSVQAIVAASVEKLTPDRVVVVMTPVVRASDKDSPDAPRAGGKGIFDQYSARMQLNILILIAGVTIVLCLAIFFTQIRLRTVRGRLIKLQNEIARARRKSDTPPPAAA
jgi:type III secretion system YscJ/HrcJ family lipoprotein